MNQNLMGYLVEIICLKQQKRSIRNKFRRIRRYWHALDSTLSQKKYDGLF